MSIRKSLITLKKRRDFLEVRLTQRIEGGKEYSWDLTEIRALNDAILCLEEDHDESIVEDVQQQS